MKISVIIPTFNRMQFLDLAIESVLGQSLKPDEVLVIDDGSTDNSGKYIKNRYPDVTYIYQENSGVSAARNVGIATAKNPWLAFLDSDDRWHRNKLEIQSDLLIKHPEYRICHSNETWIKDGRHKNQKKKHKKRGGYIFKHCLPLCVISPSSVLLHATLIKEVGMFDESLPVCEDYDLWLRICSKYPVLYVNQPLVKKYGGHGDQLSTQYWGMDRFRIRALDKLINDGNLSTEQTQLLQDMLNKKLNIYINGARKHHNKKSEKEFAYLVDRHLLNYGK